MNAESDKLVHPYSEQLTELAEKLQRQIADEDLLDDIHKAIEDLLWDNEDVEADIRRIVQEQHNAGNLRDETFELVQRMLDRMVTEHVATDGVAADASDGDPFGNTTILEKFKLSDDAAGDKLQIGSVLRNRFLLQAEIAGGSMGVVYKALDRRLAEAGDPNPSVAIKVLTPQLSKNADALRALQQEAAKGRCLSHTNIVRFIDLDRDDDLYFIVMEWMDGRSLASVLDDSNNKKIDKSTALDIVRQIAKALDFAHRRGVVHADVKPGNIMLTPSGVVKLFDFGIARVKQKQADAPGNFDPGVLGAVTPVYSSMQVLTGEEPTAADDVFSLGCLMYRLIAGYRVFGPRNAAEAADSGMEPQRPQGLDDVEWAALRKALAFARVSRFASPQEFVDALGVTAPIQVTEERLALDEPEIEGRRLLPSLLAATILLGGAWGLYQSGLLDQLPPLALPGMTDREVLQTMTEQDSSVADAVVQEPVERPLVEETAEVQGEVESEIDVGIADGPVEPEAGDVLVEQEVIASIDDEPLLVEATEEAQVEAEPIPEVVLVDFSNLPIATIVVPLAYSGNAGIATDLYIREDRQAAIVDLVRTSNIEEDLVVRIEEVAFSGNRSPWAAGQYQISDDGIARFPPGQDRARFTISMTPDPLREPDREVSLVVREYGDSQSEFAMINLHLEDDDLRRFESELLQNVVSFAVGQVSVSEGENAVPIDIVRFNPDQTTVTVEYSLRDVTATEGDDYFAPSSNTIEFGPGQRSARILIPLVQDSDLESDEAFVLEMPDLQLEVSNANIFRRIAVMIRDDDSNQEQALIE